MLDLNDSEIKITIIYDNNNYFIDLKHGFGFSCFIQKGDQKIIFDTGGNKDAFFYNIEKLKINLQNVTHIFFSHQHWDHTAGFKEVINQLPGNCTICIPFKFDNKLLIEIPPKRKVIRVNELTEIFNEVYSFSLRGTSCVFKECFVVYEQSLVINSKKGLIILTGCAHPGINKIIKTVKSNFNIDIYLVIGGFHLYRKFQSKLTKIIAELKAFQIKNVAPCHCTGKKLLNYSKMILKRDSMKLALVLCWRYKYN